MLFSRFENVPFDFVFTTIWSLGVLTSYRGLGFPLKMKMNILKELEKSEVPTQAIMNIPSLIFSLSCMFLPNEVNDEVYNSIRKLSERYMEGDQEMMEPIHASTLLLGWSRANYHNEEFLHKLSKNMKRERFFFNSQDQDLVNILNCFAELHFKDESLIKNIHEEIMTRIDDMKAYNVLVLSQSYARLIPNKKNYYIDIAPRLVNLFEREPETLDMNLYANQWLTLACFKGRGTDGRISLISKMLQSVMNRQERFNYSDFSGTDASNILVALSSLRIEKVKFIRNFVSVVEHHMKEMSTLDLINMAKSSFYLRKFPEFINLYPNVHSELVMRLTNLQDWERQALVSIYTEHNLIPDSPFVQTSGR